MADDKKGMVFSPGKTEAEKSELSPLSLTVVLTGFFLAATDLFIVNVALPSIGASLHTGTAELELVVAGYTAAYACLLVAGGRLGDLHGRRRMFMLGMVGFVVSSALCGFAPTGLFLVLARILQGMTAAAMVPQVLATIQATASGARRQRAIAIYAATVGIATIFGEVVGGLLISANIAGLSWRPLFIEYADWACRAARRSSVRAGNKSGPARTS